MESTRYWQVTVKQFARKNELLIGLQPKKAITSFLLKKKKGGGGVVLNLHCGKEISPPVVDELKLSLVWNWLEVVVNDSAHKEHYSTQVETVKEKYELVWHFNGFFAPHVLAMTSTKFDCFNWHILLLSILTIVYYGWLLHFLEGEN